MLGKEDVLLWFKDLESYKRIEVMYDLLNMCIPFEIRFLGSCIEEIGKHTYQELRGPSIIANDAERLAKDAALQAGLGDEGTRHRAVIYMSVLSARNCTCANWYYRTLLRPAEPQEHVAQVLAGREDASAASTSNVISELLLFYTLGLYHPAFTFEQKRHFFRTLHALLDHCRSMTTPPEVVQPPSTRNLSISSHIEANPPPAVEPLMMPAHAPPKIQNFLFTSGPPEVRAFPAQSNISPRQSRDISPPPSPLPGGVSQSPCHVYPVPMPALIDAVVPPHLDSNLVAMTFVPPPEVIPKSIDDQENHFISEEKREAPLPWPPNEQLLAKQNGIRFNKNYFPPEQFANLKIDAEKPTSTNSNSSAGSSRNQSPTETPTATPAVTPHGPGRGPAPPSQQQPPPPDAKPRVNGLPPPIRLIQQPPDQPPFSAVPSFNFPPRYFHFRHPHLQHQFHALPHTDVVYNYPMYYSSVPQHPPRNPNCCNCGGIGHTSVECTSQSVEDITQTPYALDYDSPTVPDNPPEK